MFENYKDLVNSDLIGEDGTVLSDNLHQLGGEAVTIDWNVFSNELDELDDELLADDKSEVF